ncbi:redoxin domain-containing protein [Ancylomarina sp. DW003]|nr:AhpC/TSA family protein [Ancylomarina sp. DW003]MDE5422128.1 redoxin domain-containing protein [Ancylomarina sp. DW003]
MNVKYILFWMLLCNLCIVSCKKDEIFLTGNINGFNEEKIFLSEIKDEHYSQFVVIDSARIKDGKFEFSLKNKSAQLYYIGNGNTGGKVFVEPRDMQIVGNVINSNSIKWNVLGAPLHDMYDKYLKAVDKITCQNKRDSLSELFYRARDKGNREEMARIKSESSCYYSDKITQSVDSLTYAIVNKNKNNPFGIYLYKSRIFLRLCPETTEEVNKYRKFVSSFTEDAAKTHYVQVMERRLDLLQQCAIGSVAPEITGKDTLDNVIKLSDFRGKYVIVDFWSSGCKYCRLETPNFKKALEKYRDKNLTVLGVSSDWKKEMWMKAIHEDESHWDHLKIGKENINEIMDSYCIEGIPHIILVDPEGKILAKDLRGKDIYEIPGKFLK